MVGSASKQMEYRGYTLLYGALGAVGFLNALGSPRMSDRIPFLLAYLAPVAVFLLCYRALAVADSPTQVGGYLPSKVLGLPRTRRLLFLLIFGYGFHAPLLVASFLFSSATSGWRPFAMRAPQASLLMIVISTGATAFLLQGRYQAFGLRKCGWRLTLAALVLIASVGTLTVLGSLNFYVFVLSATAIGFCIVSVANLRAYVFLPNELFPSSISILSNQPF